MTYQTILLAVDLCDSDDPHVTKALEFAKSTNSQLHLVHAVEIIPNLTYETPAFLICCATDEDLEQQFYNEQKEKMAKFIAKHKIPTKNAHLVVGDSKEAILSAAKDLNANLILVGSHKKHSFFDENSNKVFPKLGSTANAIIKVAPCDVLILR